MTRQHRSISSSSILFVCAALFFFTAPLLDRSAPLASAAPIVFESSTLGPIIHDDATNSLVVGGFIHSTQSLGVQFTVSENMQSVTVGGHFGVRWNQDGGMITASIIKLGGSPHLPNGVDAVLKGTSDPFALPLKFHADHGESAKLEVALSVSLLKDEKYALIFKSHAGAFGTVMQNNHHTVNQSYYSGGPGLPPTTDAWSIQPPITSGSTSPYYFVTAVPEPTSGLLAIFSFAGIVLRRGRRSRSR